MEHFDKCAVERVSINVIGFLFRLGHSWDATDRGLLSTRALLPCLRRGPYVYPLEAHRFIGSGMTSTDTPLAEVETYFSVPV